MTSQSPLVSVMTLTYNHERYIAKAIESVLAQKTDFKIELIIGEDCSTDDTRAIVDSYARKHNETIRVIAGEVNVGALGNIERIHAAARGKYLATLEGDDYWNDELKLQKQVDYLERNPAFGLIHSDVNHLHEATGRMEERYNYAHGIVIPEGDVFEQLLDPGRYLVKTPTALFRRELHDRCTDYRIVRENGWVIADLFNWLSMARFTKFKYIPEAMATYRINRESAGNTASYQKKINIHRSIFAIRFYFADRHPVDGAIHERIKDSYVNTMLYDAFQISDAQLAREMRDYARENKLRLGLKRSLIYHATGNPVLHKMMKPLL